MLKRDREDLQDCGTSSFFGSLDECQSCVGIIASLSVDAVCREDSVWLSLLPVNDKAAHIRLLRLFVGFPRYDCLAEMPFCAEK